MSSLSPDITAMKWVVYQTLLRRPCRNRKCCTGPRAGSDLHRPPDTTVWTTPRPSVPWAGSSSVATYSCRPAHGPLQRPLGVLSLPLCQRPVCKNSVHFFCWTVLLSTAPNITSASQRQEKVLWSQRTVPSLLEQGLEIPTAPPIPSSPWLSLPHVSLRWRGCSFNTCSPLS